MSEEFDPTNYEFRNGDKPTGEFETEEGRVWYGAIDKTGSIYQTEEIPVYFAKRINLFSASFDEQYALAKSIGDKRFGSECKHDKIFSGRCVKCLRKTR